MKLLLNEMLPHAVAEQLRRLGHDVVVAAEAEQAPRYAGVPDAIVLARAQADGRTVVTDNARDYVPLASAYESRGEPYRGVVYAPSSRFDRSEPGVAGALVRALDDLLRSLPPEGEPFNRQRWLKRP